MCETGIFFICAAKNNLGYFTQMLTRDEEVPGGLMSDLSRTRGDVTLLVLNRSVKIIHQMKKAAKPGRVNESHEKLCKCGLKVENKTQAGPCIIEGRGCQSWQRLAG